MSTTTLSRAAAKAVDGTADAIATLNTREAIAARLIAYADVAARDGASAFDDLMRFVDGVPADRFEDDVTAVIGRARLGRVLPQDLRIMAVKALTATNRPNGPITGKAVAAALGVSEGLISSDKRAGEDKPENPAKTDAQKLADVLSALKKIGASIAGSVDDDQSAILALIAAEARRLRPTAKSEARRA